MTIEVKPYGTCCNLDCAYCYERESRAEDCKNRQEPDVEGMIAAAKASGDRFAVFGGEPLLTPKPMLERFFAAGGNSVQTNGLLIDEDHIALFRKYRVGVGVSIDGPGDCNSLRTNADNTELISRNITRLRDAGIAVSLISVMHRRNAMGERLDIFKQWGERMYEAGIQNINCHFMQHSEAVKEDILSPAEEKEAFLDMAEWLRGRPRLRWQPFMDIGRLLLGQKDEALCIWRGCDPYTTSAVYSVEADLAITNCGHVRGNGPNWLKADTAGYQRQECLKQTPQEYGGCKGCRFFPLCTGGCPGEAIDGDWRNRTVHCEAIKGLFRLYEDALLDQSIVPASVSGKVEERPKQGDSHGDHGDKPHGDLPHGDHYDAALLKGK